MHHFIKGNPPVDMVETKRKFNNQWDKSFLQSNEHTAISNALFERQKHYCAYCETKLSCQRDGHIEHLERRDENPERIFDWSNLFFSCKHQDSCGKYKDNPNTRQQFNSTDIVDPSQEDPLDYFTYDNQGGISPKDEQHRHKAEETIRIFNLALSSRLKGIRKRIADTIAYFLQNNPTEEQIEDFLQSVNGTDCISVYYSLLKRRMA